jgi:Flp pilus assembly protein TadG
MIANLSRRLKRLRCDASGLALIEFAFAMPILMVLGLTGAEVTNYITTRMRVSQVALHLADNSARIGTGSQLAAKTITETDINDLLTGAGLHAGELDLFTHGRVVISSVEPVAKPNTSNRFKIAWQRCRGAHGYVPQYGEQGDTGLVGVGPVGQQVTAPDNGAAMFVEVAYRYQPLIDGDLAPELEIREVASMLVRDTRDLREVYNNENAEEAFCDE